MTPLRAMPSRTALVVGATGLVGSHCLAQLLADEAYDAVTVLGRSPIRTEHPKLRAHVVDFDRVDTFQALAGARDVFCCLGTTLRKAGSRQAFRRVDHGYPVAIARAAVASGAEQFLLVSALGASPRARAFYSRVKGETEADIAGLPFKAVHIFRPSLLKGARAEVRLLERLGLAVLAPISVLLVGRMRRFRPIEARTVAACMVAVAVRARPGVHVYESETIASCAARARPAPDATPSPPGDTR